MDKSQSPFLPLKSLDTLWFQVAGTLCNLRCKHCFISCAPDNHTLGMMTLAQVRQWLDEAVEAGVKEYYFTGGEPFMNREIYEMLEAVLAFGPVTVLTNATRFTPENAGRLARIRDASPYTLELRVSVDGFTSEANDPIRGEGTFAQAIQGFQRLIDAGFLPIITVMRSWPINSDEEVLGGFRNLLREIGCARPRLKLLPALKMGAEAIRDSGYHEHEYLTAEMMRGFDTSQLLCRNSRIVSDRGIHACPILVDQPDAAMGLMLSDGMRGIHLNHQACTTCYTFGAICSNPGARAPERLT